MMAKVKVLLVEDEFLARELIKDILCKHSDDFTLIGEFSSAVEALDSFDECVPDIVITDINMPAINGIEMSRRVFEVYPDVKVVIISGYDNFEYAQAAVNIGVSGYILKPITENDLMDCLNKLKKVIIKTPHCDEYLKGKSQEFTTHAQASEMMKKVEKFIIDNLVDEKLTLAGTAKHFYINASYLSRVFKQRSGISFRDFVNRERISRALEYFAADNDIKAYEVGCSVGISDPNYFSTLFKKYIGMTITQYRSNNTRTGQKLNLK